MNRADFPGAIVHGDAWRYFCALPVANHHQANRVERLDRWCWFLLGWQAKGRQRVDVRR